MDSALSAFVPLLILFAIGAPAIAVFALVRVSALQKSVDHIPKLIARIYNLEQSLALLERRLASLSLSQSAPSDPAQGAEFSPPVSLINPAFSHGAANPPLTARLDPATNPVLGNPLGASQVSATLPDATTDPEVDPKWPAFQAPLGSSQGASPVSPAQRASDFESLVAGRWLNLLGVLALVIAVVFFLKYAFDNDWIGPSGRIAVGIVTGFAMFPLSDMLLHRGYRYFAESIVALGAAVLYLSIWTGWHYYGLFSQTLAFGFMVLITAATVVIALLRDSERIALLALIGGALTPVLTGSGENNETALFSYLALLALAMLVVSWTRRWRNLLPLLFAATVIYFWGWYAAYYGPFVLGRTLLYATIFFLIFAALPVERSIRVGEIGRFEIYLVLANSLQYLAALSSMLWHGSSVWPDHRTGLAFVLLSVAAIYLFIAMAVRRQGDRSAARILYGGLALTFATTVIPVLLDGQWITIAFAVEAVALVLGGLRIRSSPLRFAGLVLYPVLVIRLAALDINAAQRFLLNARFLTFGVCALSMALAFLLARRSGLKLGGAETKFYYVISAAANLTLLIALSQEVWDQFGRIQSSGFDQSLAQELALSVLWILYAGVLMIVGMAKRVAAIRWQALGLLGVAIAKVFLFDSSFLRLFYRVVSFLILGVVLVVVSFFYQHRTPSDQRL